MGEELGAEVWLEKAPLKYEVLPTLRSGSRRHKSEWCSLFKWDELRSLCESGESGSNIGSVRTHGSTSADLPWKGCRDLSMEFLHDGRPPVIRDAVFEPVEESEIEPRV